MFRTLADYLLCQNETEKDFLLNKLAKSASTRVSYLKEIDEIDESDEIDETDQRKSIYLTSPFYKDVNEIFVESAQRYPNSSASCKVFLDRFAKRYLAYSPWWTGICHESKLNPVSRVQDFRYNTSSVESLWSLTKESLRANVLQMGKLPIPAERYIGFLKNNVRSNIVRYRLNIPKERLNTRKRKRPTELCNPPAATPPPPKQLNIPKECLNTGKRKRPAEICNSPAATPPPKTPEITFDELHTVTAQWDRKPKCTSTPRTAKVGDKRRAKRLFGRSLATLGNDPTELYQKLYDDRVHGTRCYIGFEKYENRILKIDIIDLFSVRNENRLTDSIVEWVLAKMFAFNEEYYVVDSIATHFLFESDPEDITAERKQVLIPYWQDILDRRDRILIFPLCDGTHYYLISLDLKANKISVMDSLRRPNKTAKILLKRLLSVANVLNDQMNHFGEKWEAYDVPCTQQGDEHSCGVFLLSFAESMARGGSFTNPVDQKRQREIIFLNIAKQCYQQSLCMICGDLINDLSQSVQCSDCGFHTEKKCMISDGKLCIICDS